MVTLMLLHATYHLLVLDCNLGAGNMAGENAEKIMRVDLIRSRDG